MENALVVWIFEHGIKAISVSLTVVNNNGKSYLAGKLKLARKAIGLRRLVILSPIIIKSYFANCYTFIIIK